MGKAGRELIENPTLRDLVVQHLCFVRHFAVGVPSIAKAVRYEDYQTAVDAMGDDALFAAFRKARMLPAIMVFSNVAPLAMGAGSYETQDSYVTPPPDGEKRAAFMCCRTEGRLRDLIAADAAKLGAYIHDHQDAPVAALKLDMDWGTHPVGLDDAIAMPDWPLLDLWSNLCHAASIYALVADHGEMVETEQNGRPTIPHVVDAFADYLERNPVWGSLHVVLDDGNTADIHVQGCIEYAIEQKDVEGERLGRILLTMTRTQRGKLPYAADAVLRQRSAA